MSTENYKDLQLLMSMAQPVIWQPKMPGDEIVGAIRSAKHSVLTISPDDGENNVVIELTPHLKDDMKQMCVKPGDTVLVRFIGKIRRSNLYCLASNACALDHDRHTPKRV